MLSESNFVLIRTAAPINSAAKVRAALGKAGAGKQGNYEFCSGSYRSTGRFLPMPGAKPAIGRVGRSEQVEEEIIETLCHKDKVEVVIAALKKAHPYEEPPIDILPRLELL